MRDLMRPGRFVAVDSTTRLFVGHDLFYFADAAARARFVADPLRYSGPLTDPVTLRRFRPTARSPRFEYRGRAYYFTGDSTRAAFVATPDSFATRRGM